jgi:hypothetical protein
MIEAFFSNIYAILGAIVLACFVGYIAWRNGHKARRAIACDAFRRAVLDALPGLYPDTVNWPVDIRGYLRNAFPALQSAVVAFRPFVSRRKLSDFDLAWHSFYGATDTQNEAQKYHQYMGFHEPGTTSASGHAKSQELFHTNVQNLFKFANET